jgi:hypothetical protein
MVKIADDAAHPGGRALIRLDERRMVVRFDFEDGGKSVADVTAPAFSPGPWSAWGRRSAMS